MHLQGTSNEVLRGVSHRKLGGRQARQPIHMLMRNSPKNPQVNAQLKGHLKGALNGGASVEQVRAVRQLAIHVCEAAGMRVLTHGEASWGWRTEVQDL